MEIISNHRIEGYVRTEGSRLLDGSGRDILLRGFGLGNWFLPEGYMWKFPAAADRPRRIEAFVSDLLGERESEDFWETYRDRYITETDLKLMADWGANSVRLPLNSRYLLTEDGGLDQSTMSRIDAFIDLCRRHQLYVILDLHGAPGGQTGTNIDDSAADRPELFLEKENRDLTIELWRQLALRYCNEKIVAGYDLLNEPLPDWFSQYNDQVMPLYREIIQAVREVDEHHMIILEGVHWATDWSIFDELPDGNLMLQFHKYWNNPDIESIQPFLDKRLELNVPIYMGEGGENNADWYAGAFTMFEDLDISWNFWTWKKLGTGNSPVSIPEPEGWIDIIRFLEGGNRPDDNAARRILRTYLDNLSTDRCDIRKEILRSIFRKAPVSIPAIFYGYRGPDRDYGPGPGIGEYRHFRQGDCQSFGFLTSVRDTPNFQHGAGEDWAADDLMYLEIPEGRWFSYDFDYGDIAPGMEYQLKVYLCGRGELELHGPDGPPNRIRIDGDLWTDSEQCRRRSRRTTAGRITVSCIRGCVRISRIDIRPLPPERV